VQDVASSLVLEHAVSLSLVLWVPCFDLLVLLGYFFSLICPLESWRLLYFKLWLKPGLRFKCWLDCRESLSFVWWLAVGRKSFV